MAQRFDVPGRLAEGREALEHTQTYVSACAARGYAHPDLTAYGAQVRDWYDGEDGLDLGLLDGDCAQLRAAVNAAEEALRMQRAQLGELATAWRGPGADAAVGFVRRHCDTGEAVAAGLRAAAEGCAALRDDLWRLVDDKVAAAVGIDDRSAAQRPAWLAAAHTVTAGAGDTQAAEDIIDHQVKPHVDNDIGTDWLAAMRSARTSVTAAYDAAAAAATPGAATVFEIPGELGPRYQPDDPAPPGAVMPVAPAAAAAPPAAPLPQPDPVSPAPAPPDDPAPLEAATGPPADAGLPAGFGMPSGGGLPAGGGFGGLMPRIADAIGSLLGSPDDGLSDPEFDEPFDDEPEPAEEVDDTDPEIEGDPEPEESAEEVAAETPTDDAVAAPADQQAPQSAPEPLGSQPIRGEETPCEIAADELPQAGQ